jgi:hypothetical protein
MNTGERCKYCKAELGWGSTLNEWYLECRPCGKRFNDAGEEMDLSKPHWDRRLPRP